MAHLSQIDPHATYDGDRKQLRITGTTDLTGARQPEIVAIHFTIKQARPAQGQGPQDETVAYVKLPYRCLGKPDWMARFGGVFASGEATVSAIAVGYQPDGASLETLVWSQRIEVLLDSLEAEETDMDNLYPQAASPASDGAAAMIR